MIRDGTLRVRNASKNFKAESTDAGSPPHARPAESMIKNVTPSDSMCLRITGTISPMD